MPIKQIIIAVILLPVYAMAAETSLDLTEATIHWAPATPSAPLETAAQVLKEEIEERTGLGWSISTSAEDATIVLVLDPDRPPESFLVEIDGGMLQITGADARGILFGVGHFLRNMIWEKDAVRYPFAATGAFAPAYPLRGHQLGYRYQANSYDAWDDAQYDQYIRELALFGCNSIENIPFQDDRQSPHMKLDRRTMNRRMSELCARYGLEYWVWTPAEFDLADEVLRAAHLAEHLQLYDDCPELSGVFFPGGDPGANPPELVLPFIEELAGHLRQRHPHAKVWLSLQWFNEAQCTDIYAWIDRMRPEWFGGLVTGPGSPGPEETRRRLTRAYPVRHYPDITHTVRCQYPVQWWDPAYALTLGREPINPQPVYYGLVHNYFAPYSDGFITYSDGMNDDVNKMVWSRRGWDPGCDVRETLIEYGRFFFDAQRAGEIADAILALEKNWEGSLAENGGVPATLALWQRLERELPQLANNWRWQKLLVRAYYDAYTRERLLHETQLEVRANALLLDAAEKGASAVVQGALTELGRAESERTAPELRERIAALYDDLFQSIGLQSSVDKYRSCGYERGCSLDFLDYPLNNRWFLEDEFKRIGTLTEESDRVAALMALARWADPGPGSFYDNIGHPGQSSHVLRPEGLNTDPAMERNINPGHWWWDSGFSRQRLSWQSTLVYPLTMVYAGLDPDGQYTLRMTGYGEARPRANGHALVPSVYNTDIGEIKEFPVPKPLTADGTLTIVWDPIEESHLNWRQHARVAEVWLLKE